jgi:putative oxidoreductase
MAQLGVPMPLTAAAVTTFMELPVAFAAAIGAFTRPAAVLMFFYTLGTALIGHLLLDNDGYGSSRRYG